MLWVPLIHPPIPLPLALFPLRPLALASGSKFLFPKLGGMGEMSCLYFKGRLSKRLVHYNEKRQVYSHKALSVSSHVCCFQRGRIPSSLSPTTGFPHTSLYPKHPHKSSFPFPSPLSALLEYPVFHSAAQWAVWMCLVGYVTTFLESLPPARFHCITCQPLFTSQWGSFFPGSLRNTYDPLMEMALSSVLKVSPLTGESLPPCSRMTCCITAEGTKGLCSPFRWLEL